MKKSRFSLLLFGGLLLAVIIHFALIRSLNIPISWRDYLEGTTVVSILTLIGFILIIPALSDFSEQFVGKFMIMTTVQMLGILSYMVYVFITNPKSLQIVAANILPLFIVMLFFQSLLLIRSRRS
ncbi:MAG: hypothetical protein EP333_08760 [Bacteroidetes bacterium]|nr:MAG: hypothetical protein EP333_08760 [Bacteroidota bacterium]TNE99285.1 MAG: hypothetical protein EP322_03510 [Bacteroidota bacterium]